MPRNRTTSSLRVTAQGIVYMCGGLLFLGSGLFHGELLSTICGFTLLAYSCFALFHVCITWLFWKKCVFKLDWQNLNTFSVSVCSEHLFSLIPILAITRFSTLYSTAPNTTSDKSWTITLPITSQKNSCVATLPSRGVYQAKSAQLMIKDIAGFFCISIKRSYMELPDVFTVMPVPEDVIFPEIPYSVSSIHKGKSTFKRSDDYYEVRPYTPGDDPRKINWKVFAHTGEMSIRQGELLPPPSMDYYFVINSYVPVFPNMQQQLWFDVLINRAASVAIKMLNEKKSIVLVSINNEGTVFKFRISPTETNCNDVLLNCFASPQLQCAFIPGDKLFVDIPQAAPILFCTLPDSTPDLIALCSKKEKLFIYIGPTLNIYSKQSLVSGLRFFLFYSQKPIITRTQIAFQKHLSREFSNFKKAGCHVRKI